MWTLLWTDALVYVLLVGVVLYAVMTARSARKREPWRRVFGRPMGAITALLLAVFVLVAFADSIHYKPAVYADDGTVVRYGPQVISVFDNWVTPLRMHDEETFSEPFATHSFTKKMIVQANGQVALVHPELKYGGAHLDGRSRHADIIWRLCQGVAWGIAIGLVVIVVVLLLAAVLARRRVLALIQTVWHGRTIVAWRSMAVAVIVVCVVVGILTCLSGDYHFFGTDKIGRDVLYMTLKSIRTGVVIGSFATLIMLPFALVLGPMAGYFRGWVDDVIQYVYTTLSSIPPVLLIVAAVLMLQVFIKNHPALFNSGASRADVRLLFLCIILGITSWAGLCRVLRAETLKLSQVDYVQAAKALGVGHLQILRRHILPNVMHLVLIQVVLDFSALVLAEAVLTYIGVGVSPNTFSWGNMINSARLELARDPMVWWPLVAAFIVMLALVLSANLFSDTVRDAFDPNLRHEKTS